MTGTPIRFRRLGFAARLACAMALATLMTFTSGAARAQSPDVGEAAALVRSFLAEHGRRFDAGQTPLLNDAAAARPYVVDGLAHDGLQGALQFDPVYNGQDADVSGIEVRPDPEMPLLQGAAQIQVKLVNFGRPMTFVYTLVQVPPSGRWQISDIYSEDDGWSLLDLVQDAGFSVRSSGPDVTFDASGGGTPADTAVGPGDPDADVGMEMGDLPGDGTVSGGSDLVFILDGSGSMWGQIDGVAKITTAKRALSGLLGDLAPGTNVGLMAYGHRREGDCGDTELIYPVTHMDPAQFSPAIEAITPRGKTPIAASLVAARRAFSGADRPANVLLISDGIETCGGDPCAAAAELAAHGIDTRVHVVGFDLTADEQAALQCIAEKGNGNYYAAANADEFLDAVNQAVRVAETERPEPAPEPVPAPAGPETVFEETFDGPDIDPAWQVLNPAENLATLDGNGALFVAAIGGDTTDRSPEALNRFVLDEPLPDGDFDLVLAFRTDAQSGNESVWLSLFEDAHNQVGASAWIYTKGCGAYLGLTLTRLSGPLDGKPETTGFDINLFDGPMVDNICNAGPRAYADAVLAALSDTGAELRLKRRGRDLTAALRMELPAAEGRAAEPFEIESEPVTILRIGGKPSFLMGQFGKAGAGESLFEVERFAIEKPVG
ncbi:vWA domain-containing protein [Amorphus orientalis]|uniref:Mg-chelatase subunit ChlD n=1 Tax=Amorphus orientalis TaxID=649198 RepID=A0AAE3VMC2_9HYPH|nr:VWA domain-containing protein [Amorphus orientalis]MDQ0314686.1 Mg-chelatase subunit ChlD [Amorphus orientalis]